MPNNLLILISVGAACLSISAVFLLIPMYRRKLKENKSFVLSITRQFREEKNRADMAEVELASARSKIIDLEIETREYREELTVREQAADDAGSGGTEIIPISSSRKVDNRKRVEKKGNGNRGAPLADNRGVDTIETQVVGVSFTNDTGVPRQSILQKLAVGDAVAVIPENNNSHDIYAYQVVSDHGQIGYLDRNLAKEISQRGRFQYMSRVLSVGASSQSHIGCKVRISLQPVEDLISLRVKNSTSTDSREGSGATDSKAESALKIGRSWYSREKLRSEGTYLNGKEHGLQEEYYESGDIKSRSPYEHGVLHGPKTEYGTDGKQVSESIYENGLLVEKREELKKMHGDVLQSSRGGTRINDKNSPMGVDTIDTQVVGASFANYDDSSRQEKLKRLKIGDTVFVVPEQANSQHYNAYQVVSFFGQMGYLDRALADRLSRANRVHYKAEVLSVGGSERGALGSKIRIYFQAVGRNISRGAQKTSGKIGGSNLKKVTMKHEYYDGGEGDYLDIKDWDYDPDVDDSNHGQEFDAGEDREIDIGYGEDIDYDER